MLGSLENDSIENILNGPKLKEIRASLAQGKPHAYCENCVKAERLGASSERAWHNSVNPNFDYATAGDQYHYPVIFDVRWNITCNLSCNYCGEACSSKWASLKKVFYRSGTRPYYQQVCDFIEKHREHIHEVALVGGEPLLLPENERLLDVIPDTAIVTLITNLNVDLENNKIFQKLQQRQRVGWSISFDNIGDRFEYVRYGTDWQLMLKNLDLVQNLMKHNGHWGGAHAVYNIYNATRLCEFREFVHQRGLSVLWQNLFQPSYLDPFLHGPDVAALAIQELEKFYALNIATDSERGFFDQALEKYQSITAPDAKLGTQFADHIEKIETLYHADKAGEFKKLWPELAHLCK
jgi:sulfatase maturation enzyme AslB (radical SAM superfamily)